MCSAVQVLALLKDDSLKEKEKQSEIEKLFRLRTPLSIEHFSRLVNVGKKITDFKVSSLSD